MAFVSSCLLRRRELRSGPGSDCKPAVPKPWMGRKGPTDPLRADGQGMPGLRGMLRPKSTNKEEKKDLSSGAGLSKMDFQDMTAVLLLGLKWTQPEALEGLGSPCSMEENVHCNYSLGHCGQRVSKRHKVIFL